MHLKEVTGGWWLVAGQGVVVAGGWLLVARGWLLVKGQERARPNA
jgi:hypothetical protein